HYTSGWSDQQTITVTVTASGNSKTASEYGGVGPIELWGIQQAIDSIVGHQSRRSGSQKHMIAGKGQRVLSVRFVSMSTPSPPSTNGKTRWRCWSPHCPSRFTLKVRKCFVLVGGLHYCHLPKMDVIDWVRLFYVET